MEEAISKFMDGMEAQERMYIVYTLLRNVHTCTYHVLLIDKAIDAAQSGSPLYKFPHVADLSNKIVEVLIQCMDWNIMSRQSGISVNFQSQSCLNCSRKQSIFLTSCRQTSLIRLGKGQVEF